MSVPWTRGHCFVSAPSPPVQPPTTTLTLFFFFPLILFNSWVPHSPNRCVCCRFHFSARRLKLTPFVPPERIFGTKEMRLLMLGLDAAGKTSKELLFGYVLLSPSELTVDQQRSYTSSS
jgi:hypothetical protein